MFAYLCLSFFNSYDYIQTPFRTWFGAILTCQVAIVNCYAYIINLIMIVYYILLEVTNFFACFFKIIAERFARSDLPDMEKKKYLVPRDMSVGQFIHILTRRLHLAPGKALFVFVNNTLPQTSSLVESVYESYKDEDGFLYMCYSSEKAFGGNVRS